MASLLKRFSTVWRPVIVAIPARNESECIGPCLRALAGQRSACPDGVVVCLNNCTDDTADTVRRLAADLPFAVVTVKVRLAPQHACAGVARRIAMERAAVLAGPGGILLTTDADGRVGPDWVAANHAALAQGAEAVAGRAEIDPDGARLIPPHLHAADAEECAYAALLDEIQALVDPDPADPWPRHDEHSGASIAVTVAAYHRAGGMPAVKLAEDRAFFTALRRVDARIRHAPEVRVVVSARLSGRAAGGMADTMRRRLQVMDDVLDERLEPAVAAVRRARLRAWLRHAWRCRNGDVTLAFQLGLSAAAVRELVDKPYFGAAWAEAEASSPVLQRRRVSVADLRRQTMLARRVRDALRAAARITVAAGPGGTAPPEADAAD